jgi:hypothetical protein
MHTGDSYVRPAVPVLATMLANALMARTARLPVQGRFESFDKPARPPFSASIRAALGRGLAAVDGWLHRQTMRRWEAYLAESRNVYDLEERIRRLERGGPGIY